MVTVAVSEVLAASVLFACAARRSVDAAFVSQQRLAQRVRDSHLEAHPLHVGRRRRGRAHPRAERAHDAVVRQVAFNRRRMQRA